MATKSNKKYFELADNVFGHVVHVYLGYSYQEVAKLHPKKRKKKNMYLQFHDINEGSPACHVHIDDDPLRSLLMFQERKPQAWLVSHEAVHATRYMFDQCSMQHNIETDELFACYQSYLVREILKKI